MSVLLYGLLGLIQGLTEFLPVSSSGHLILAEHWLGFNPGGVALEITVHVATLVSVVAVYWREILRLIRNRDWPYLGRLALGCAVTTALILPFRDWLERITDLPSAPVEVGIELIITAGLLVWADRVMSRAKHAQVSWPAVVWIGVAQAVAALPGISRSGATIGMAVLLGIKREEAARFSFLMSIPIIAGAAVLKAGDIGAQISRGAVDGWGLGVAFVTALFSGILAIYLLLWMLKRARLSYFAVYCALLGVVALVFGTLWHVH